MTDRISNFDDARRRLVEQALLCRCGALNRPGVVTIHLDEHWQASCDSCGQFWNPLPDRQTKEK